MLLCGKRGGLFCLAFNVEHMGVLPICMSVHHVCAWCPRKGVGSPGTGVSNGCELPGGCWEPNSGHVEERSVLLIPAHLYCPLQETFDNASVEEGTKQGEN